MGWFFINIILPVAVPAAFMLLARFANLPPEAVARTGLLALFQRGQLGWVALGFSASCAYDVFSYLMSGARTSPIQAWLPLIAASAVTLVAASGHMAALGALYPPERRHGASYPWWRRFGLLVAIAVCTCVAAFFRSVVHFCLS